MYAEHQFAAGLYTECHALIEFPRPPPLTAIYSMIRLIRINLVQLTSLGVPSPFSGGRVQNVDHLAFCKAMLAQDMSVWEGLHISPRGPPSRYSRCVKLCTCLRSLRWFALPDKIDTEP